MEKKMKNADIIKIFGEKVNKVKGFIEFLTAQEDAILDVAVNEKLGVGAFILDRHWWSMGSGGIGMAVIIGIFWNGKAQTEDPITYRDQYNPRRDKWENFYKKIGKIEASQDQEVRIHSLKKEPLHIWLTVESQTKKEEFLFKNKKKLTCDKCFNKIGDASSVFLHWPPKHTLLLCETCIEEIKKEFQKKKYSQTKLNWGLGGSVKWPTEKSINNQTMYLKKLVLKLKKEVIK